MCSVIKQLFSVMWGNFGMRKRREDDEMAIIEALYGSEKNSVNGTRIHTSILTGDM